MERASPVLQTLLLTQLQTLFFIGSKSESVSVCVSVLYLQPSQCCCFEGSFYLFMERKRTTPTSISFFFLLSICTLIFFSRTTSASAIPCLDTRCPMFAKAGRDFQELKEENGQGLVFGGKIEVSSMGWDRRLLGGPGSSPPRCTSKCGRCTPCRPVHVPVPPGMRVTAEYYPEAWRCKCGNKLYMP
ncbi:EPIDERMAL PATTERNING FACTOR-like protein 6 [Glycine max]|uniref:Epidermal patterning factor-like protein n=1 Tax=Glycine soja TaxID=3848 RepID=A0A0B2P2I7_GLYSO|nr:EPIDERMAL PATTERNING FACTOR-like protein 6 [Glycine soja]KAH1214480.1 EPIDERMAL PATTERNING FACTOR-like protein 6 [Glycine max]KHN01892.1 EPIDERMAL PATTERNING FACTOR-like protein 6 [Glycine soja]RZB69944.1 EPIDERMAL PATTERNING FACTOR-like protein 6 isoform A [Glycine soja]